MITKHKLKFLLFLCLILIIIGISFTFNRSDRLTVEGARDYILGKGVWAPAVFYLLYLLTSVIVFPGLLLSTASGMIWGPWLGTFYTVTAATLASFLPFTLARVFGRELLAKWTKGTKIEVCDRFLAKNGFVTIVLVRMIPLFPWDAVNYGAGLCGFRFRSYALATLIGIIPGSLTYNLIGDALGKPLDTSRLTLIGAVVGSTLVAMAFYQWRRSSSS